MKRRSNVSLATVVASAGLLAAGMTSANAAIEMALGTKIDSGNSPSGVAPWLMAKFIDNGNGTLNLELTAPGLSSTEFISDWNFNSTLSGTEVSALSITEVTKSGIGTIGVDVNPPITGSLQGLGFDFGTSYPTANNSPNLRFQGGDYVTFLIDHPSINLTLAHFSATTADGWYSAAHIQNLNDGGGSVKIGTKGFRDTTAVVPEPSTYVAGGLALLPLLFGIRSLRAKKA
jgi:hypothetical protein